MAYPYRYAPDAEVSGAVMISLFNHYRRDDVIDSLQRHGLDNLDAERWYSVDPFIRLLDEWSKMSSFSKPHKRRHGDDLSSRTTGGRTQAV